MPNWNHRFDVSDVFHNEEVGPIAERARVILDRMKAQRWWDSDDEYLDEIADLLDHDYLAGVTADVHERAAIAEFDLGWEAFYAWADEHRVWVVTQAGW